MNHQEYIETSVKVANKLNQHLENFCDTNPEFKSITKEYTKKRIHLNGIQFYAGFKSTNSNKKFDDFLDITIAIECIMLMAYKTNRILDHKQEVWKTEEKLKETVLDERMYLSLVLKLLNNSKANLGKKYNFVRDIILKLVSNINQGFWYEKNYLNLSFSPLKTILQNWESKYIKRNILFNGVYDYASLIGYYLGCGDKAVFRKFESFLKDKDKISHSGQMVNDLSDYSVIYDKNVKSYQDAFSDIKNGIITFPNFILVKEKNILQAFRNPQLIERVGWRKKVIKQLIANKVIKKTKILTKKSYDQNILFWKKIIRIDNELLFFTYLFLLKNKYYLELSRIEKTLKNNYE